MSAAPSGEGRLLVVGDLDRLGPIARDAFAPMPISGVRNYLSGIAEIPRAPTQAVLVGVDPQCRRLESAMAALRQSAGSARLVVCCEPAYESWGRRAVNAGADEYVIFPPGEAELEQALAIPGKRTRDRWVAAEPGDPSPSGPELVLLADLIASLDGPVQQLLDRMAAIVREGLGAESAMVMLDGNVGRSKRPDAARRGDDSMADPVLTEPIRRGDQNVGQIMAGRRVEGGYGLEHMQKLRHYGTLLLRLLDAAQRSESWRDLALKDELTGLGNRRYLMDLLERLTARASRERFAVTALMFDIDDFKRYNDQYGHAAGDAIIRETGQLFVKCCRKDDVVCRFGGDEFVVVFWDAEPPRAAGSRHPAEIVAVLNRFKAALQSHAFSMLGPEAHGCLTISGGLATFPWQAANVPDLLQRADEALLEAKRSGKNSFWLVGTGDVCKNAQL